MEFRNIETEENVKEDFVWEIVDACSWRGTALPTVGHGRVVVDADDDAMGDVSICCELSSLDCQATGTHSEHWMT